MSEPQVSELKRSQFLLVASHGHEHAVSLALRQSQHRGDTFNVRLYTAQKKLESLVKECGSQCHFQFLVANHEQCFNDWSSKTWKLDGDLRGGGERHGDPSFGVVSLSSVFHSGNQRLEGKGRLAASWPSSGAAQLIGLQRQLASSSVFRVKGTRCPPTVWLGSLCPSLSYGDEEASPKAPTPFCFSLCGRMSHFIARWLSHADREGVGMGDYKYLPPSIHMSHAPGSFSLPVRILLQL